MVLIAGSSLARSAPLAAAGAFLGRGGPASAQSPTYWFYDSFGNVVPVDSDAIAAGIYPPPLPSGVTIGPDGPVGLPPSSGSTYVTNGYVSAQYCLAHGRSNAAAPVADAHPADHAFFARSCRIFTAPRIRSYPRPLHTRTISWLPSRVRRPGQPCSPGCIPNRPVCLRRKIQPPRQRCSRTMAEMDSQRSGMFSARS